MDNLKTPLRFFNGSIVDNAGNVIIKANGESKETPLLSMEQTALLMLTADLLNKHFNGSNTIEELLSYVGLKYPNEYFELCANTYSFSQEESGKLFKAMDMKYKKLFIAFLSAEFEKYPTSIFHFFLNLL